VVERSELEDSFLTVAEVAEMLKLNQQTVRNWIDQGSLPALRVGRRVRIKRSDLDRLLDEGYRAGSSGAARSTGPSAQDFWGGEAIGIAEPAAPAAPAAPAGSAAGEAEGAPARPLEHVPAGDMDDQADDGYRG
jgi:excisionase family DNA binding protein